MNGDATADAGGFAQRWQSDSLRNWLAISAGTLGGFMALLDTSIANSALPVIQGEIGATQTEGTWIGTAYLTTEIVIIPLISWLERVLGMRRLLLISATVFTIFSIACGMATNLTMMIAGRLGQGISGGVLVPTAFTLVARLLPPEQQAKGIAIITGPMLVAPIIGPVLGGWLTESYSWHYAFFINVPFCLILLALLIVSLPKAQGNLDELTNADWFGVVGMVMGLGCLTVMLEEGYREQWFDSRLIWNLAIGTVAGFILIAIGQARPAPVLKLALLRDRVQFSAFVLLLVMGAIMFSSMFIVPQFLVTIAGYNAFQAGLVMLFAGMSSCAITFIYPALIKYVDLRIIVGSGMLLLAAGSYCVIGLTADTPGSNFKYGLLLLGIGIAFMGLSLQQFAVTSVSFEDVSDITSLVTIARNLGGSIGLASLASFQGARLEFHHWRLQERVSANDPAAWDTLTGLATLSGGGPDGWNAAYTMFDARILVDALVMTFNDSFYVFSMLALVACPLALLLKPMPTGAAPVAAH